MMLQKDMHCMNKSREQRGSATIETAISFSITLIFIAAIVSVIVFYRSNILMQRSVEQCCEEMSLIPPTSVIMSDTLSTLINAFPDVKADGDKASEVIRKVSSAVVGINTYTGNTIEQIILEGTMAHVMADRIRSGYIERNNGSEFFVPDSIDVDLNIMSDRHVMEVNVTYDTVTLAGRIRRKVYSAIPLYGSFELYLNDSTEAPEKDIWSEDNFTRGDFFRENASSNLPKTFPVIDSYNGGTCESVLSIDLTAPYYSNDGRVMKTVKAEIDDLAGFDGADVVISGQRYVVSGQDIRARRLNVVIPSNSPETSRAVVSSLTEYARINGVDLNITEYGTSHRYTGD
ncbi:hypothetical protein SAMN02910456_00220 [Ruminococcaceae bacterium YRB3002]|nr:hypothetical protein SAMN02910456_00220 [Ruminococcaceae bacterium YRB3002]